MSLLSAALENLSLDARPSSINNTNTAGPERQNTSGLIYSRPFVYAPLFPFPHILRPIPLIDQAVFIDEARYPRDTEIKSPVEVITDQSVDNGMEYLFTNDMTQWNTSFLQHIISYGPESRIRGLSLSNFFLVNVSFPFFHGFPASHPIALSDIGAPGLVYPYNTHIIEGAAIIGIDWGRWERTNRKDLGIVIGWIEQYLGWENGDMLARVQVTHVSLKDPTFYEEISTLRFIIRKEIVDTVGTRFEARFINYPVYHVTDIAFPPPPPGIRIRQKSLPEIASSTDITVSEVRTKRSRRKDDNRRRGWVNRGIKKALSIGQLRQ